MRFVASDCILLQLVYWWSLVVILDTTGVYTRMLDNSRVSPTGSTGARLVSGWCVVVLCGGAGWCLGALLCILFNFEMLF